MRRRACAVLVVFAVVAAAGCQKTPEQKAADWIDKLKSPDVEVSGQAGRALIEMGEPAVPALATLLNDPEARVRRAAASTLWGLGTKQKAAVPALAGALRDPDPEVRLAAAMALESAGSEAEAAVPALVHALKDSDANVRLWAARALGAVGPAARPAVPALVDAAKVDFIRGTAEEALRKIQGAGSQ
jgi:HEAT repeat protein